jgi:PST family polysaccharide transporter
MIAVAMLAVTSGILFWLFRNTITATFVHQSNASSAVGWLVIGVVLTIATGYQTAVLTGLRRIGDLARISVLSAMFAAVAGSAAIILWREAGIVMFVLALPAATFAIGCLYVARIGLGGGQSRGQPRPLKLKAQISSLVRLGTAVTLSIFVALAGQLLIRTMVERDLGPVALGHFQAAWTITVTYLGFIFQAMGSDYLPRLTAAADDAEQTSRMVNDQTETALLMAAPALLMMIGLAPWVLSLLYTSEFREAAMMLRWQGLGDLLKIVSWPIAFVLLGRGAGRRYGFADVSGTVILVVGTAVALPLMGIQAPGAAYFVMNLYYLALIFFLVRPHVQFQWHKRVVREFALIASFCGITFLASNYSLTGGAAIGCLAAAGCAALAVNRLEAALPKRLAALAALARLRTK